MSEIISVQRTSLPPSLWDPNWVVTSPPSRVPPDGFCTLNEAAGHLGVSAHVTKRVATLRHWKTFRLENRCYYRLADVLETKNAPLNQPPVGFISVQEARVRVGVSRSGIYRLAKQNGWIRYLSATRDLFFLEADVRAYLEKHGGPVSIACPAPEEMVVDQVPQGYSPVEQIALRYGSGRFAIYNASTRHNWRRAKVGRWVYFHDDDVQAYFDPEHARGYTPEEAAERLSITVEQVLLASRLNRWRCLSDRRFRAYDVERSGAIQGIENYVLPQDAIKQLGINLAQLIRAWKDHHWQIEYIRIGKSKAAFVLCEHIHQYGQAGGSIPFDAYYSTNDIRQMLKVSRQRVHQLADLYQWPRIYPSPRHVCYLRRDVDEYLACRRKPYSSYRKSPK